MNLFDLQKNKSSEPKLKLIVRVITSTYFSKNSLVTKKELRLLKRKSNCRLNDLFDDADHMHQITNLDEVDDGIYEVETCNHSYWYGQLDDYDFVLVPYVEETGSKLPIDDDSVKNPVTDYQLEK